MEPRPAPIRIFIDHAHDAALLAIRQHLPAAHYMLVCDENTWAAAGQALNGLLTTSGSTPARITVHLLSAPVRATVANADILAQHVADSRPEALIAVGSGTINDLCKYAAFTHQLPYAVLAAAASMNGYTAANASLEEHGTKRSFAARPPVMVLVDRAILDAAPKRLTRAGIGDTLCRTTVEADMLMSHLLLGTPYPRPIFDQLRGHEAHLMLGHMHAKADDKRMMEALIAALLDAGDAMTAHGSSAVASQGEHMIAHTLELKYGPELRDLLHGEMIAITSMTMSLLQHRVLLSMPVVKPMPVAIDQFIRLFGREHGEALAATYAKKLLSEEQAEAINTNIRAHWPEMKARLAEIMVPTTTLERALIHSGIRTKIAQVGLAEERYRFATSYAYLTRERFTFLDLAAMNAKRVS